MSHRFRWTRFHRAVVPEPERYRSFRVTMDGVRLDVHPMCGIFHQGLGKCGNGSNGIFWIVWSIVLEDGSRRRVTYRDRDVVTLRSWSVIW